MFGMPLYWRETHRQPKFLFLDGRLVLVLLLTIMHIRVWTIALALITILVLWYFGRKGVSADSILRFIRARIVGRRRTARGYASERSVVDFGFETESHVEMARQRIIAAEASRKAIQEKKNKKAGRRSTSSR